MLFTIFSYWLQWFFVLGRGLLLHDITEMITTCGIITVLVLFFCFSFLIFWWLFFLPTWHVLCSEGAARFFWIEVVQVSTDKSTSCFFAMELDHTIVHHRGKHACVQRKTCFQPNLVCVLCCVFENVSEWVCMKVLHPKIPLFQKVSSCTYWLP